MSPTAIVLSIVLAIAALGGVAYWDEQREAQSALDDFAHEQATLARGLAAALEVRTAPQLEPIGVDLVALRAAFAPVSEPERLALLRPPGEPGFLASSGRTIPQSALQPIDEEACWLDADGTSAAPCWQSLARPQAASLGLPERTAIAGISGFVDKDGGRWRVLVAATARRERDRERRAVWRLILGFALTSGLVLAFGTLALRKQRRELALARELAVREAVRASDERLVRADKLATMGALSIGIAHEVSTPLGVILGRAEQLAPRVQGDARAERAVAVISEQTARIGRVVRAVLTLARGGTPSFEKVDPEAIARAAVDLVAHRFTAAAVDLRVAAERELPALACDPPLLEQALVNLLLNACDACEAGGHVDVGVRRVGDGVEFSVLDDGAGIGAQAALRATEPFFTTKPEGAGTGLGLAIANEIVDHHQGKLAIAARQGQRGTMATIRIPAMRRPNLP